MMCHFKYRYMSFFSFFKQKVDLSNKLSSLEQQLSFELLELIKEIRINMEIQFLDEFNPIRTNIYESYKDYSNEDFKKMVRSSFYSGFDHFQERLKTLGENVFISSIKRAGQKQLGNELDIILKGTDLQRRRLFKLTDERKKINYLLLNICLSKDVILAKHLSHKETDEFILLLLHNTVSNIK